jgi:uncharacterized protein (TIRG00374 family)
MKRILLFIFSLIILISVLIFVNPYETFKEMSKVKTEIILTTFIIANLATFVRVLKWKFLLKNIKIIELIPIQLLGITISNLTPGKSGEPIKSLLLKLKTGKSISSTLPSVIWERILDILVLLIFGFIGVIIFINKIGETYRLLALSSFFIFFVFVIFLLFALKNKKIGTCIFNFLKKFSIFKNINDNFVKNFYSSVKIRYFNIFLSLILTILAWLLDGTTFFLISSSLTQNKLSVIDFSSILSVSILISLLSFLPGGIGGTEAIMILLLIYLGFTKPTAASIVLLGRAMTLGYSFILGYISFIYLSKTIKINSVKDLKKKVL